MEKTHSKPHTKVMPPTISCGREYLVTKTFTEGDVIFLLAKWAYEVVSKKKIELLSSTT